MNSGKVLLGMLAGIATGALLGVLFAPEKGSETRKKISKKGVGYVDSVKEKFTDLLDDISEKVGEVKEQVADFTEKTKEKAADAYKV